MTDATSRSSLTNRASPVSEDRRQPKHRASYMTLWVAAVLCVVFALISMFLRW
ncbi:hypothetical protein [Asticcacaulis sp. 201]|uniref:hypothetical protein n=1 Tax=Asticcacaulis sp. 201 TaxID=3028787 RepID=UPI0029165008|nr:hypothetical protein [Asticcacaulis sp. 201]MDV6331406.1 hypothetical protein [Asticcacaulis sp. 201]